MSASNILGKGAYGTAYKYNNDVIKEIHKTETEDGIISYIPTSLHEILLLKKYYHSNIIKFKNVKIIDNVFKVCLEHGGMSLHQYINKTKYVHRMVKFKKIIFHVIVGLNYIHKHGFTHGDLKPSNIVYNKDKDVAKIIDFGSLSSFRINSTHTSLCTYEFRSPEAWIGDEKTNKYINPALDIWSLGMVILYYLSKEYEITFKTEKEYISYFVDEKENNHRQYKIRKDLISRLDEGMRVLVRKMFLYNPESRITANELYNSEYFTNERLNYESNLPLDMDEDYNKELKINKNYLSKYTSCLTSQYRSKLINEIYNSINEDRYECLNLSVWILDRFMTDNKLKMTKNQYKLSGYICLMLASVLIEEYPISVNDVVELVGGGANEKDIISLTDTILLTLKFDIYCDTFDWKLVKQKRDLDYGIIKDLLQREDLIGTSQDGYAKEYIKCYKEKQELIRIKDRFTPRKIENYNPLEREELNLRD
jgi:serine/threonine protein kinase